VARPTVKVYPSDMGGCGFYRCIWPGQELVRQGAPVDLVMPNDDADRQLSAQWFEVGDDRRLVDVVDPGADVVVLQRPFHDFVAQAVGILQRKGVRVVVEIDDDFDAISARNVAYHGMQPHNSPRHNKVWLRQACLAADLVVCTTPALAARYAPHGRFLVVPNFVPQWYLGIEREPHEGTFVGWSGSIETHPDDLQVTGGAVQRAIRSTGATFAVVGTGKGVRRALGLAVDPPASGWAPITRYPYAVAELDIGIVPLEITPFNQAKSALKMMEMAACGVVPIASPTADNWRMYQHGIGVLADSPRRWEGAIKAMVNDPEMRQDIARAQRTQMTAFTVEHNAEQWLDAWQSAVNTPRKEYAS